MKEFKTFLDDLLNNPYNSLIEDAKSSNKIPIGYSCRYIPEILLSLGNLFPVRLRSPHIYGTQIADVYLSSVICSYTRSLLEYALDGGFDFLGGIVFTAGCDHLRRLYDNLLYLRKPNFIHILDVPHKITEHSIAWYAKELQILLDSLSSHFGVDTGKNQLINAINSHNDFMKLINSIGDLRKNHKTPLTGTMFHKLLTASNSVPKDSIIEYIKNFYEDIKDKKSDTEYRSRLMIVGCHLDDPGFIEIIESLGGLVVADRFCTGSLPETNPIELSSDPLLSIACHTLKKTYCPRMMEDFNKRINEILKLIEEYKVNGVIVEIIKFCDIWGIESSPLISCLREKKIPVLRLEREYRLSGEGQLRTRVQAFLESIT